MLRHKATFALVVTLALAASCGDKLDPVTSEIGQASSSSVTTTSTDTTTDPTATGATGTSTTANTGTTTTGTTTPTTPSAGTATAGLCGTTSSTITYTNQASKLISDSCLSCHDSGGNNPTLSSYAAASSAFSSGEAQDQVDSGAMPQGRTLTADELCIFDQWKANNYAQ